MNEASPIRLQGGETFVQVAYRALRADIIRGVRAPGERLRLERLKTLYAVGPTPLREALQKLCQDGLVRFEGNRGFTVEPLDPNEFADMNVARTAIEKEALRLSISRGGNDWEARVVAARHIMRKEDQRLAESGTGISDAWESANTAFHTALVSACGSHWLLRVRDGLHDLCERYRRASIYRQSGARDLMAEHHDIAEAALARDADAACALIEQHFAATAATLRDEGRTEAPR